MVSYPITVTRRSYRGSNASKQSKTRAYNQKAAELESYVNNLLKNQTEEIKVYHYSEIAEATGYPLKEVEEILYSVDCGQHGFTARKTSETV